MLPCSVGIRFERDITTAVTAVDMACFMLIPGASDTTAVPADPGSSHEWLLLAIELVASCMLHLTHDRRPLLPGRLHIRCALADLPSS
jgi:hypothetical protein